MFVNREEFIQELILREQIRDIAATKFEHRASLTDALLQEENKLRGIVRKLIKETAEEAAPHRNTGINVLADLLKKIIPQLEQEYKMLTTDAEQRESFRAHVVNATQNSLSTSQSMEEPADMDMALPDLEEQEEGEEVDVSLDVSTGEDKFIDIDETPPEDEEEEEDTFGLDDEDETGRNFAQRAFEKVEKQIIEAYSLLSNEEDKQLFYDYLITNLKLYFDRFEEDAEEAGGEDDLGLGGEEDEELEL